jgi:hypothetical protein
MLYELTLQLKTVRRETHMYLYLFDMDVPITMGEPRAIDLKTIFLEL